MPEEQEWLFTLMDVLRYRTPDVLPEKTSKEVVEIVESNAPSFLLDIYLYGGGEAVCALLHPRMTARVLKGWLRIGAEIKVLETVDDMIVELELTGSVGDPEDITKIKKEVYRTMPSPLYSPEGYYVPLLSDEGYIRWDGKWAKELGRYAEQKEEVEVGIENISEEEEGLEDLLARKKRVRDRVGYKNTQKNTVKGKVIMKSKIFTFLSKKKVPLMFAFIISTQQGLLKVYVWEESVRHFFCIKEGDRVAIQGFKIKRRKGRLIVADRTYTDADTKYAELPEISVNPSGPVGQILKIDEQTRVDGEVSGGKREIERDAEFSTVSGIVEYVSSLLRWKDVSGGEKRMREFVYVRVSGICVKLFSSSTAEELLRIKPGKYVEIRHLRECAIGKFVFFISSIYTQLYFELQASDNTDHRIIACDSERSGVENAIGYIPLFFRTWAECVKQSEDGLGILSIKGKKIPKTSPDSTYLHKERRYYGQLLSLEAAKKAAEALYMDETERYVVLAKLLAVKHKNKGDDIGESVFDISYTATDISAERDAPLEQIEETVVVRIGEEESYIDIQVFQNHFLPEYTFQDSVCSFLNTKSIEKSIYETFSKRISKQTHFVMDVVRISETEILYIGITTLD